MLTNTCIEHYPLSKDDVSPQVQYSEHLLSALRDPPESVKVYHRICHDHGKDIILQGALDIYLMDVIVDPMQEQELSSSPDSERRSFGLLLRLLLHGYLCRNALNKNPWWPEICGVFKEVLLDEQRSHTNSKRLRRTRSDKH